MNSGDLTQLVGEKAIRVDTSLVADHTIKEALAPLRQKDVSHKIAYFYVVDKENKLVGIVPTRRLLFCEPESRVADVMDHSVIKVYDDQTIEEVMEVFARHSLLALPVVDHDNHLIGMVDVQMYMEESFDVADSQHRQDVFQMIGITIEEGRKPSLWHSYRLRMPWLFCNMFAGVVAAIISRINEQVLGKFLLLAMFIPLVLTLAESTSMQSMTQSLQLLRRPKFSWKTSMGHAFREWNMMAVIAFTCAFLIGSISLLWGDGILASLTIAVGIFIGVCVSVGFGFMIPVFLHSMKLDPKVSSGPVVLMFADILTTLLYLSIASWWLL